MTSRNRFQFIRISHFRINFKGVSYFNFPICCPTRRGVTHFFRWFVKEIRYKNMALILAQTQKRPQTMHKRFPLDFSQRERLRGAPVIPAPQTGRRFFSVESEAQTVKHETNMPKGRTGEWEKLKFENAGAGVTELFPLGGVTIELLFEPISLYWLCRCLQVNFSMKRNIRVFTSFHTGDLSAWKQT